MNCESLKVPCIHAILGIKQTIPACLLRGVRCVREFHFFGAHCMGIMGGCGVWSRDISLVELVVGC